jgi:MoaA/NifB/PqqE/SkfB family radical SAM enzyme
LGNYEIERREAVKDLILDGTKIGLYKDRIDAWKRGERIAPITVDLALTRACNYRCAYCYGQLQDNLGNKSIDRESALSFLDDCAEIGVNGVSLVSDGESTISPYYTEFITYARKKGLAIALGTHGYLLTERTMDEILPALTYLRFNISAGDSRNYGRIHGVKDHYFRRVVNNILTAVRVKQLHQLPVTIGLQMVLMPEFADQILPLTELAVNARVDYLIIKHCSDDEKGSLGVNYGKYRELESILRQAEERSTEATKIVVKWSKIREGNARSYTACYGPPFLLQVSGTGLVAPCGMFFNDRYSRYHMGDITKTRFRDIISSDRYWSTIRELASPSFNAMTMCGCLCLQHSVNKALDTLQKTGEYPPTPNNQLHKEFV